MRVGRPDIHTTTYVSSEVPRPIPDLIPLTSTVTVADTRVVRDVEVRLDITHPYVSDLDIHLVGPNGVRVALTTDNGDSGDNFSNTTFDDEAAQSILEGAPPYTGRFRPETPLSALDGIPANGTWSLEFVDDQPPDNGTLDAWSLTLVTGQDLVCGTCSVAAPTAEVLNLRWAEGPKTSIEWDAAAGGAFYNVYRGSALTLVELLDGDSDSCLRMTAAEETTGQTIDESPGAEFFWYLVRAANAGGEGPVGNGSAGPRRQESSGICP
jgi:subtilisin-like proprotein convertase family protein